MERDSLVLGLLAAYGATSLLAGVVVALYYDVVWPLVVGSAGLAYGALSALVYTRRLMFVAAGSPHAAFLAAMAAVPVSVSLGVPYRLIVFLLGLLIVYMVGYLVYKGMDPDDATSLMVSLSGAGGVLAAYYVLSRYAYASQVTAAVIGDPLLATREDSFIALAVALLIAVFAVTCAREIYYSGVDVDDAKLSGLRLWLYDLALYTSIAVSAVAMVSIVGFVMEHVLVLLPGLVAFYTMRGVYRTLVASIIVAVGSSLWGLWLAVRYNLSPSAATGLLLVLLFAIALLARR